jgi:large repetitive protein
VSWAARRSRMRPPAGRPSRRRVVVGACAGVLAGVSVGFAVSALMNALTTNSLGLTSASVNAEGTLSTPTVSGHDVTVSWPADTLNDGTPTTYYVLRDNSGASGTCTGVLSAGTLSCTDTAVPSGTHTYAVVPTFRSWTGASSSVASPAVGSASMTLSPTTVTVPGTLTGSISNFIDGETVTFKLDGTGAGATTLSGTVNSVATPTTVPTGGSASVSVTLPGSVAPGAHTVYLVGSQGDVASVAITVKATPTIVVTHSPAAPTLGQTVTYTATVTAPSGDPTPTGTVSWGLTGPVSSCSNAGSTTLSGSTNVATATCVITVATATSYSAVASVSSDANYNAAGPSNTDSFTVGKATPTIAVTHSPTSPTLGQVVTFTATVTGPSGAATPSGTISWTLTGQVTSCSSTTALSGTTNVATATCTITASRVGSYSATATVASDANYTAAGPSTADTFSIAKVTPTIALTHSPTSPTPGQSVTYTATVTGPAGGATPSGTMTWSLSGPVTSCASTTALTGTTNVATATCTITASAAGTYTATASMAADSNYNTTGTSSADSFTIVFTLHISALSGSGSIVSGNHWNGTVTVSVVDGGGNPVTGVVVTGGWSPTSGASPSGCTTAATGQCTIATSGNTFLDTTLTESWTASTLALTGYTYQASNNVESSITVSQNCSAVCANRLGGANDTTANTKTETITLSATNVTPNNSTVLILVYRHSAPSDVLTFGTSTAISSPTLVNSVSPGGSTSYYMWAYQATGTGTASGTVVLNFTQNNVATVVDVVVLSGNNTTSPIVQSTTGSNSTGSTTASATLTTPSASDGEIVIVGAAGDPTSLSTPTGWTQFPFQRGSTQAYGAASYFGPSAQSSTTFTLGTSQKWGTVALDIRHS